MAAQHTSKCQTKHTECQLHTNLCPWERNKGKVKEKMKKSASPVWSTSHRHEVQELSFSGSEIMLDVLKEGRREKLTRSTCQNTLVS